MGECLLTLLYSFMMSAESSKVRPARERILDAAAEVMRRDGLAHTTTKQIARQAQCSEALLYKHFPDKRDIFLCVLAERSTGLGFGADRVGKATVKENLIEFTEQLMIFYRENFPMAASIFGSTELLESHRVAMRQRGAGPEAPVTALRRYLEAEAGLGRLDYAAADLDSVARLLTGAALHEAFLAAYADEPLSAPKETALRLVHGLNTFTASNE